MTTTVCMSNIYFVSSCGCGGAEDTGTVFFSHKWIQRGFVLCGYLIVVLVQAADKAAVGLMSEI